MTLIVCVIKNNGTMILGDELTQVTIVFLHQSLTVADLDVFCILSSGKRSELVGIFSEFILLGCTYFII